MKHLLDVGKEIEEARELCKEEFMKWDGKLPATYAGQDLMSIFNLN